MLKFKKGFTLIELLVVIAIIGILVSVVWASISSANKCKKDNTRRGCSEHVEYIQTEAETIIKIKAERYKSCLRWADFEDLASCDILLPGKEIPY